MVMAAAIVAANATADTGWTRFFMTRPCNNGPLQRAFA
jgi:hypothetical protein